jgi:LysR family transcriptional regulator, regulator for metE and metH
MDLDTRTFELLEAIAADGTLTAASRRLHVSQPALSQRLTGLERRLGLRLFEREGKRLVPTRAGRRMVETATAVLTELRAAQRDIDDLRHGRAAVVRFASQCSTNYQWLPLVVHAFAARCPDVQLRIETAPDDDVLGALLTDRLDVALVNKPDPRMNGLATLPLFDDEMVAVVPADHAWARRRHLGRGDLDGANLVVFDSYDPARVPPLPLPIPDGAKPARVTTTPVVSELVIELVAAGQGIGILPGWVAAPYAAAGRVATVRLSRSREVHTWYAAWRRGDCPPHISAFVDVLRDHFADQHLPAAV